MVSSVRCDHLGNVTLHFRAMHSGEGPQNHEAQALHCYDML